ncbi:MAG: uroporphyrinogen-III C-methyltransferase [Magnetococcales bacterium]|nr:uroporphyrinogen-III C-methyltransferase [Magnetococcales bacterium]NGZ27548.1 uroporphyrinogen-III C-methyltransferase [Magnetococcales bacterium]
MDDKTPYLTPGMVALVGAGPGDPDLLTLGAVKAMQSADVVVHDALVSDEVMAMLPEGCQQISAGKRGGHPSASQKDICDTLVQLAKEGKRVVRLKGGDPFVFGRGGEEAARLAQEGIPFRIVPGLTSGIAGPAYAGIPVTHRAVNPSVILVTGHESADLVSSRIDWQGMGRASPVIVLYMAIKNLHIVTEQLQKAGCPADMPVAVIRWATTSKQQTLITNLERALEDVAHFRIEPPAIVVIGEVVRMRQELAWFPDETLTSLPSP